MNVAPFLIFGSGMLCLSGILSFVLTRRYGWLFAALMPFLAMVVLSAIFWQDGSLGSGQAAASAFWMLAASTPILIGSLFGILLALRGRL